MWRLAWRNLWRNHVRTAITGSAIALTLSFMFVYYGTSASSYGKMKLAAARSAGGNILVHAEGYWDSQESSLAVQDAPALIEKIVRVEGVTAAIPRVIVMGLVSSARGNAGVRLLGIEREAEAKLTDNSKYIEAGKFLEPDPELDERVGAQVARLMAAGKVGRLVLSQKVTEDLVLNLGDRVVVTAKDARGKVVYMPFRLAGIADTGSDLEGESIAWAPLPFVQDQVGHGADAVTQIGVLCEDDERRTEVRDRIAAALGSGGQHLEVLTWDEAIPEMISFIEIDRAMAEVFGLLIFLVVAFGIANTFLMAVLERVREFGVLGALGMSPGKIAQLVVFEAVLLGTIFSAVALALGYGFHSWIAAVGIDFSEMAGGGGMEVSGVMLDDLVIYSEIEPMRWLGACALALVLIVVSASYPAWKATRMDPAQAMRTYE